MTNEQHIDNLNKLKSFHNGSYGESINAAVKALEHEQALREAFNIAVLYGKEKGMEAIDKALYQMGKDGIKEQEIKALEQEPCEDAISRQAVCKIIDDIRDCVSVNGYWAFLERLKKLPPVKQQEPKTGHWISDTIQGEIDGQIVKAFICSECGAISVFRTIDGKIVNGDLCPNCGAKMIESQEREV